MSSSSNPTFPVQIPFVSLLPATPLDDEIKALAVLMYNKPFHSPADMAILKTKHGSWKDAHEAYTNELKANYIDSNKTDKDSFNKLHAMHRMLISTPESVKAEYLQLKAMQSLDIVALDWPSLCAMADPELMARAGLAAGMKSCCWNCGKRPAGAISVDHTCSADNGDDDGATTNIGTKTDDTGTHTGLLTCSKCEKAAYCSRECQAASWWHHKRSKKNEFACFKEE